MLTAVRARLRGDDGIAMLTVLLFMLVFSMFGTTLLYVALNSIPSSRHEQSFQAAVSAAEAGVDDYLIRLDQDYNYATNPSDGNAALTSDPSKCVPLGGGGNGCYEYSVDTSQQGSTGTIYLNSTGIVGKVSRTIRVGLRPFGFLDALSTSNYNLVDPVLQPVVNTDGSQNGAANGDPQATTDYCVYWAYQKNVKTGGVGPAPQCSGIVNYWVTGNKFDGPMQSNDEYYICGTPEFDDRVSSGDPSTTGLHWKNPYAGGYCGTDAPKFAFGTIQSNSFVELPPATKSLQATVTVNTSHSGCLYTGPTSIQLNGATMTVVSPDTLSTNANCVGPNVPLPENGTIYVQDIPAATSDPNYGPCKVSPAWTGDDCHSGDAFVQGTLAGQLTIATDNNIIITGSVKYDSFTATAPRRVLGLIATNTVEVNHTTLASSDARCNGYKTYANPGTGSTRCNQYGSLDFGAGNVSYTVPVVNPEIDAAILSLNHSFSVMDFTDGPGPANGGDLGSVNLHGVVAGKFMDIEGSFTGSGQVTGYGVNYTYDRRLENGGLTPPNFLDPTRSFWHRTSFAECPSQGSSNCSGS